MNHFIQMQSRTVSLALGLICAAVAFHSPAVGGDWPQILGPNRDGQASGEALQAWDASPEVLWQVPCGAGYAGVAVARGRVLLFHREGESEVLQGLDGSSGKELWRRTFPAVYTGGVDPDTGPRCVPVVSGDRVIVHGAGGDVHAVRFTDGELLWSRPLREELGAGDGYFGAGSTPLVIAGRVIVEVGGDDGAGLVALALGDGKTLWKSLDGEASYASPVSVTVAGRPLVLAPMRLESHLIDPADGSVQATIPFGRRGPSVVAATPLIDDSTAFMTASYGVGCRKLDFAQAPPTDRWEDQQVIASQYVTPVRVGEALYAITGREDFSNAGLVCVRWSNGEVLWADPEFGTAHFIAAGDRILAVGVDGRLDLIQADLTQRNVLASSQLPAGTYRSLPALSDGVLYLKRTDSAVRGALVALRVGSDSKPE